MSTLHLVYILEASIKIDFPLWSYRIWKGLHVHTCRMFLILNLSLPLAFSLSVLFRSRDSKCYYFHNYVQCAGMNECVSVARLRTESQRETPIRCTSFLDSVKKVYEPQTVSIRHSISDETTISSLQFLLTKPIYFATRDIRFKIVFCWQEWISQV